jgi:hypothetical protein
MKVYACFFDNWDIDYDAGAWSMRQELQGIFLHEKDAKVWAGTHLNTDKFSHRPKCAVNPIYHYKEIEVVE